MNVVGNDSVLAIATVGLAVVTACQAWETRRLAAEGARTNAWADTHHQEALTPILKMEPPEVRRIVNGGTEYYQFDHIVRNTGSGPALEPKVTFTPPSGQSGHWDCPPLGVGDQYRFSAVIPTGLKQNDPRIVEWRIVIEYQNLFGAIGRTTYTGNLSQTFYSRPGVLDRSRRAERVR